MAVGYLNDAVDRSARYRGLFDESEYNNVAGFYDSRPQLSPTPLRSCRQLAAHLGLGDILIKDETQRFGLDAFKITGARYAMETLGVGRLSAGVVCATAGNHGRAVARVARDLGVSCTVFVPAASPRATTRELHTRAARLEGMRQDGAHTIDVAGLYEDAVERASDHARRTGANVISDTSSILPGAGAPRTPPRRSAFGQSASARPRRSSKSDGGRSRGPQGPRSAPPIVPRLIMTGYTRLFDEASRQWSRVPDVVLVQGGVGGLVCAAANWFAWHYGPRRPFLIACEPESAACLLESARMGGAVTLEPNTAGEVPTMMAGLRCAMPSSAAWPSIRGGIDAFVAIPDTIVVEAIELLSHPQGGDPSIDSGPSGGCGVGALLALLSAPELAAVRQACALNASTHVMAIVTEGP